MRHLLFNFSTKKNYKILSLLFLFVFSFHGFTQIKDEGNYSDEEFSKVESIKYKSALFIRMMFDNPKFKKGQKHIFHISGTALIGKFR